ncbi:MAG: hypothetical protein ABIG69_01470 [Bacteroidota bacterium]|nr:hypothetical protein [Bacteroidota bacterium]
MKDEVFYSLSTSDIQSAAIRELDRALTDEEIDQLKYKIENRIDWHDAVLSAISETYNSDVEGES